MVKDLTAKCKPLFLQSHWVYKDSTNAIQISISNHLHGSVYDVLFFHFNDFSQPLLEIRYHTVGKLSKCRRYEVQSRSSASPKCLGCSGKLYLWVPTERIHTGWDQANRQANKCRFHIAPDSCEEWYSLKNVHWKEEISILCYGGWFFLAWRRSHGNLKLGRYILGHPVVTDMFRIGL